MKLFSPDAGQPMSNECESCHEQNEDGGAILGVPVDLPGDTNKTEKASSLEQTYQGRRLEKEKENDFFYISCQKDLGLSFIEIFSITEIG